MKTLLALCTILILTSCSFNYVRLDASGSSKITADISTSQDSSGEGAQGWLDKLLPGFSSPLDVLAPAKPVVPPLAPVKPVAPPLAPVVEEEIAEPEALEDAPAGEVIEVD